MDGYKSMLIVGLILDCFLVGVIAFFLSLQWLTVKMTVGRSFSEEKGSRIAIHDSYTTVRSVRLLLFLTHTCPELAVSSQSH